MKRAIFPAAQGISPKISVNQNIVVAGFPKKILRLVTCDPLGTLVPEKDAAFRIGDVHAIR
jgi:hypothetical protein